MKKIIQKRFVMGIAIGVLFIGFYIDRKKSQSMIFTDKKQCQVSSVKKNNELTIHNQTGAKVNAAFYNKRFKRNGLTVQLQKETTNVPCRSKDSYIAVSRNNSKLKNRLAKSIPHAKIRGSHCFKVRSKAQGLVVTATGK